ncbi:hypothetical protein STEG23_024282, partial [Scotinomys teguina]
ILTRTQECIQSPCPRLFIISPFLSVFIILPYDAVKSDVWDQLLQEDIVP